MGLGTTILIILIIRFAYFNKPIAEEEEPNFLSPAAELVEPNGNIMAPAKKLPPAAKSDIKPAYSLAQMYEISRQYNECNYKISALESDSNDLLKLIETTLNNTNNTNEFTQAVIQLNQAEIFTTVNSIARIERHQTDKYLRRFDTFSTYNVKSEDEVPQAYQQKMMLFSELRQALVTQNVDNIESSYRALQANNTSNGLIVKGRRNQLVSADVAIGHTLVDMPINTVEQILATIPVTPLMFTQAIRSGADTTLVLNLLNRFDFRNQLIVTRHSTLQTALNAAIEANNPAVLRLLLDQPVVENTDFSHNPINNILYKSAKARSVAMLSKKPDPGLSFTDTQKEMLNILNDFAYKIDIVPHTIFKQHVAPSVNGIILLDPVIIAELKSLNIAPRRFTKLALQSPSCGDHPITQLISSTIDEYKKIQFEVDSQTTTCSPLKQKWLAMEPEIEALFDANAYIDPANSFSQQVENLAKKSPALVSALYKNSMEAESDTSAISEIIEDISGLSELNDNLLEELDMNLFQRNFLSKLLCERFGADGVIAAFEVSKFISLGEGYTPMCIMNLDYQTLETQYYASPHTFPSYLYRKLNRREYDKVLKHIESESFEAKTGLRGYPNGNDALMDFLSRISLFRANLGDAEYQVLVALIEHTKLNKQHFKLLHRLKVKDVLLFERLVEQHSIVASAVEYNFDKYVSLR